MNIRRLTLTALIACVTSAPDAAYGQSTPAPLGARPPHVSFEERRATATAPTTFVSRGSRPSLQIAADGATLVGTSPSSPVRMHLQGGNAGATLQGLELLPGTRYYVDGRSSGTIAGFHTFARVKASGVYPGIDVVYYGNDRQLEFDFLVAPGADARRIAISFPGGEQIRLDTGGGAMVVTRDGELRLHKPIAYQENGGARTSVDAAYVRKNGTLRLALGAYDHSRALVIDPVLSYATYLGSQQDDRVVAIKNNAAGEIYVFGVTSDASHFPVTRSAGTTARAFPDKCFVSKFDATGSTLLYSVLFVDTEALPFAGYGAFCDAMALSPNGLVHTVYLSADLGTSVKAVRTIGEIGQGTVTVEQHRLLGIEGLLPAHAIEADASENIYVLGACYNFRVPLLSPVFPGGFRITPRPGNCISQDNFVSLGRSESVLVKYDSAGTILYGTFIGGSDDDENTATALAISSAPGTAEVFVGGSTRSTDLFPVSPQEPGLGYSPYQESCASAGPADPCHDGFLMRIDTLANGAASHRYSTYLGGRSGEDRVTAIAVRSRTHDLDPNVPASETRYEWYVAGSSDSPWFPATIGGPANGAFVARFDEEQNLVFSNRFGGSDVQVPTSIAFFRLGEVAVAGNTFSEDFPLVDPLFTDAALNFCPPAGCAFVSIFSANGNALLFSTFLDNTGLTTNPHVVTDTSGSLFVGATTADPSLATAGAFQGINAGGDDALLLKIAEAVVPPPNQPPVLNQLTPLVANATSAAGILMSVSTFVTDPDLDPITVTFTGPLDSVVSAPFAGGFLSAQLHFPIGTSTLTISATDGHGGVATQSTQVTVLGAVVSTTGTVDVTPDPTFNAAFSYWTRLHPLYEPTVRVRLENVTAPGVVTLNIRSEIAPQPVPNGYQLGSPPFYYDIVSTAAAGGPFTVCIDATGMSFAAAFNAVHMFQWSGTQWVDVTGLPSGSFICGQAATLGTFALFHPANPANAATTIAGSGFTPGQIDGPGGDPRDDLADGGQATASPLFQGQGGLAFDAARKLLYTTTYAGIRRVDLNTGVMTTIGGDGQFDEFTFDPSDGAFGFGAIDGVDALLSHIDNPNQIAVDAQGNLFIAQNCRVRRIDRATNIITTYAGDGFCRHRGDGGPATLASIAGALALAIDGAGNVFVSDSISGVTYLRRIDAATGVIATVAGTGALGSPSQGPALQVALPAITRMAFAPNGDLYAVSYGTRLLRLTAGSDGLVNGGSDENASIVNACAVTSCPQQKFRGDGGPIASASFVDALSVAVAANGDVLVGDAGDARIRRISAGADHVVTGAADESITTVVGHNPVDPTGFNMVAYVQGENYGLSAWAGTSIWDILPDPRGGFFFINGHLDLVRHVGTDTNVGPTSDLSVSVSSPGNGTTVDIASVVTFDVAIANNGPSVASTARLRLPLPSSFQFVSATLPGGVCDASGGVVVCDIDNVASGAAPHATIALRPMIAGPVTSTFEVSSPVIDPYLGDNTASVQLTVLMVPAVMNLSEVVFVADAATAAKAAQLGVLETVFVRDDASAASAARIAIDEHVIVDDSASTGTPEITLAIEPLAATSQNGTTHVLTALVSDGSPVDGRLSLSAGFGGNNRVEVRSSGFTNQPLSVIVVPNTLGGSDLIVTLATNSTGALTSTAAQVMAAIQASPATGFITASVWPGSTGSGIVQPRALTSLTPVRFSFSGVGAFTASCETTVPGVCTYSYTRDVSGTETIDAFVDLNRNGVRDGEPAAAATKIWTNRPPVAVAGLNQIVEATSAAGASVSVVGSGQDPDAQDPLTFRWLEEHTVLASTASATFALPVGEHDLTLVVTDSHNATALSSVHVSVRDTTPPVLGLPGNITAIADRFGGGAVSYIATSNDLVDGFALASCTPPPGSVFRLGTTAVNCTAADVHGNSRTGSFTVTVNPGTPRVTARLLSATRLTNGSTTLAVQLSNVGDGFAGTVNIDSLTPKVLAGNGAVTLITTAPQVVGDIPAGQSVVVNLMVRVTPGVTRFSLTETGSYLTAAGVRISFSMAQVINP